MSGFTDLREQQILDAHHGKIALAAVDQVALFTGAPNEAGTGGAEVTGGGYARIAVTGTDWNSATGTAPALADNATQFSWSASGAAYGTVVGAGKYASTNLVEYEDFDTSRTINDGDTLDIDAGDYVMQVGDPGDTYA
jgi:hypothetical protein